MFQNLYEVLRNTYTRFLLLVFIGLGVLGCLMIAFTYNTTINNYENEVYVKLEAIAKSTALAFPSETLDALLKSKTSKDEIFNSSGCDKYYQIHTFLKEVNLANQLTTPIYTLSQIDGDLYFGVTSANQPYYRHKYTNYPDLLLTNYASGARIPIYNDDHGTWLSVFAPLKTKQGNVVGVLQVDEHFDNFINKSRELAVIEASIVFTVLFIIGCLLYVKIRNFIQNERVVKKKLEHQNRQIAFQHDNIKGSIRYAKRIQETILPSDQELEKYFNDYFIFFKPKDIVSGDFYWFKEVNHCLYFAVVDCTGHGVPGALMSMVGNNLLNMAILERKKSNPDEILAEMEWGLRKFFKEFTDSNPTKDGMDLSLIKINKNDKTLCFSGAQRPLIFIRNEELTTIKASKRSIGSPIKENLNYVKTTIQLEPNDSFYMFSDGYPDQFGGPKNKKFMIKHLKETLLNNVNQNMQEQKERLSSAFNHWKGDEDQIDDVLVTGFKF